MAYEATVGDRSGVDLRWLNAQTLEVSFDHARFTRLGDVPELSVSLEGTVDRPDH